MRMLIAGLFAAVLLAGCAGKPAEPPVTKRVKVDESNVYEAQQVGYRIVNKKGTTLYCRKTLLTGSHMKYRTSCLTAQEWAQIRDAAQTHVLDNGNRVPRR